MELPFLLYLSTELVAKLEKDDHVLTNGQVKAIYYFIFIATYKMGQINNSLILEAAKVIVEEKWPSVWSGLHDRAQYLNDINSKLPGYFDQLLSIGWLPLSEKTLAQLAFSYNPVESFFILQQERPKLADDFFKNDFEGVDEDSKKKIKDNFKRPAQPN